MLCKNGMEYFHSYLTNFFRLAILLNQYHLSRRAERSIHRWYRNLVWLLEPLTILLEMLIRTILSVVSSLSLPIRSRNFVNHRVERNNLWLLREMRLDSQSDERHSQINPTVTWFTLLIFLILHNMVQVKSQNKRLGEIAGCVTY